MADVAYIPGPAFGYFGRTVLAFNNRKQKKNNELTKTYLLCTIKNMIMCYKYM